MEELTHTAVAGLSASIPLMLLTALWPELGWIIGAILTAIGVLSLIVAHVQDSDSGSLFAVLTLGFGLAVEFAPLEILVLLLAVAIVVDALLVLIGGVLEDILEAIEGLFE